MLVDTTAGEANIGLEALEQLEKINATGLKLRRMRHPGGAPHGVVGRAEALCDLRLPARRVMKLVVPAADDPPRLPLLLLEHLGATVELQENRITWGKLQGRAIAMTRLVSGRHAIGVTATEGKCASSEDHPSLRREEVWSPSERSCPE